MAGPPSQPVRWRVLNAIDGTGQDAGGRYVVGKNVTYQLESGQTGTVFIAGTSFTPEQVSAAIRAEAQNLADVLNLSSDS